MKSSWPLLALGLLLAAAPAAGEQAAPGAARDQPAAIAGAPAQTASAATLEQQSLLESCMLRRLGEAPDDATVGELRAGCAAEVTADNSLLLTQLEVEQAAEAIPELLTPHRANYLLPLTYARHPNEDPYLQNLEPEESLDHIEAKFQISLKLSLFRDLLLPRDRIYFGFSTVSFWQAYNFGASAPFRETNYEPEVFWSAPFDWGPFGLDAGMLKVGFSHQSNGRGGTLSRSWNRIYADLSFEKDNLVVAVHPWWRVPEDEKDDPLDAHGDDNPDIEDYMGHFEFTTVYRRGDHEWSLMLRNNLSSDNHGAVQLEWTFPLWNNLRGFAQYFNGYGESLIDYDVHMERVGVGLLLTDLL